MPKRPMEQLQRGQAEREAKMSAGSYRAQLQELRLSYRRESYVWFFLFIRVFVGVYASVFESIGRVKRKLRELEETASQTLTCV